MRITRAAWIQERQTAQQICSSTLLTADEVARLRVNALEGSPGLDDYVPDDWDGPRIATALVTAYGVLDRLPMPAGARGYGRPWPAYSWDHEDMVGWDWSPAAMAERAEEFNRIIARPSRVEVTRMEMAFNWISGLRCYDAGLALVCQSWAHWTHRGKSIRKQCRRRGWAFSTFYRKRELGLEFIAAQIAARPVW